MLVNLLPLLRSYKQGVGLDKNLAFAHRGRYRGYAGQFSLNPDYVITCSMPPWIHGAAVTEVLPSGSTTTGLTLKNLSRPP